MISTCGGHDCACGGRGRTCGAQEKTALFAGFGAPRSICAVSRAQLYLRGFARNVGSAWVGSSGHGWRG